MSAADHKAVLREMIRGEREWADLANIGILMLPAGEGYEIVTDRHLVTRVDQRDVAAGIIRLHTMPERLAVWASILMAGSLFADFGEEFDSTLEGKLLLDALWDLTSGHPLSDDALTVAHRLLATP